MQPLRRLRRLAGVITIALLIGLVAAPAALAFEIAGGEERYTLGPEMVVNDDLYAAASTVTIDGRVMGDVVVAGQTVVVNGTIEGNLIAAGQTIVVNGTVRDSARLAGQAVQINGQARIGRDLMFAGYSLETRPGSAIARDLGFGGYQALLAGQIARNVRGGSQGLEVAGTVGGNVDISVGDAADTPGQFMMSPPPTVAMPLVHPGLRIADTARIDGKLTYAARAPASIGNQPAGGVSFNAQPAPVAAAPGPSTILIDSLRRLGALVLVGLLLMWLVPGWTRRLVDIVEHKPLPAFGWGLVAALAIMATGIGLLIATGVVAAALGASTLFGLMALTIVFGLLGEATLFTAAIAFTSFVAQAMASYLGGRWLLERIQPQWAAHRVIPLLVGVVIFVAITAIPIVGGIIGFVTAIFGLGALWIWAGEIRRPPLAPGYMAPPVEPAPQAAAA